MHHPAEPHLSIFRSSSVPNTSDNKKLFGKLSFYKSATVHSVSLYISTCQQIWILQGQILQKPPHSSPSRKPSAFNSSTISTGSGHCPTRLRNDTDIQQSITNLLQSAGLALKTLSASQSDEPQPPPSERRKAFEATCNSYLKTLQAVDIGLHRQIYGLEEAGIILSAS